MNLTKVSLFTILLNLVQFCRLEGTRKNKRFIRPCFEEDENLAQCSGPDESCEKVDINFNLVRLQGVRVSRR